jgi:ABC-2 type transport system ATP-binding protein
MADPEILVLDEPTTGLDPQARLLVWDKLSLLKSQGITMLLTTHYMDEAHVLCDRVAIVDQGRIVSQGSPDELILSIGAPHIVEIAFARGEGPESDGLQGRLAALPDVDTVRAGEASDAWVVTATALHRTLPALVGVAADAGVEIETLATRSATLEDVFVALTGHQLRDD